MTSASSPAAPKSNWEQRVEQNAASQAEFKPEYQELKFTLHRKLLERINLEALSGIDDDRVRAEVRQAVKLNAALAQAAKAQGVPGS